MRRKFVMGVLVMLVLGSAVAWGQQDIPITFITVAEVHQLMEGGSAVVFVDVRNQQEYMARHIKDAISLPLDAVAQRFQELPADRLVILY